MHVHCTQLVVLGGYIFKYSIIVWHNITIIEYRLKLVNKHLNYHIIRVLLAKKRYFVEVTDWLIRSFIS